MPPGFRYQTPEQLDRQRQRQIEQNAILVAKRATETWLREHGAMGDDPRSVAPPPPPPIDAGTPPAGLGTPTAMGASPAAAPVPPPPAPMPVAPATTPGMDALAQTLAQPVGSLAAPPSAPAPMPAPPAGAPRFAGGGPMAANPPMMGPDTGTTETPRMPFVMSAEDILDAIGRTVNGEPVTPDEYVRPPEAMAGRDLLGRMAEDMPQAPRPFLEWLEGDAETTDMGEELRQAYQADPSRAGLLWELVRESVKDGDEDVPPELVALAGGRKAETAMPEPSGPMPGPPVPVGVR